MGHFIRLLAALGKENFYRGYGYYFSSNYTKKQMLSRLLKACYPTMDDTAAELKKLANAANITDKRLAETALYTPQWAGLVE